MSEWEWNDSAPPILMGCDVREHRALLRRPFSIAGRRDDVGDVELEFIHRVIGPGTAALSQLQPGDFCNLIGPLGNAFALPPAGGTALLVGGGVGIPPMIYLASRLKQFRAVAFCGALTRDLLALTFQAQPSTPVPTSVEPQLNIAEFATHGIPTVISTDDGSCGYRGYITQALGRFLDHLALDPERLASTVIYLSLIHI